MEYKNQTENRAFQEMLQAAVKRLQNRSGEEIAAKSGAVFHSSRNVLEVLSFYETIEIQLPEFRINSNMDEWHYLTLLHYLDMADGTEGSQKLITFGNLKDGLIRGTKFDRTAEQKLEKLLQDKDPEKIQKACTSLGAEFTETTACLLYTSHEQKEWDFEYIHLKTGEKRWFHNIAMCSEVNGKKKYILVMSDRTDDWKMNQALSEAVRAAETANKAKSTFLSNMSHDILSLIHILLLIIQHILCVLSFRPLLVQHAFSQYFGSRCV